MAGEDEEHDYSPSAADSRVLTMLLCLRKLDSVRAMRAAERGEEPPALHVVAENQQDQTAKLAVVPRINSSGKEPDFVNTQAIIARSIAMNLAVSS